MVVVSVLIISLLECGDREILGAHWPTSLNDNTNSSNNNEEEDKEGGGGGGTIKEDIFHVQLGNHNQAHKYTQA